MSGSWRSSRRGAARRACPARTCVLSPAIPCSPGRSRPARAAALVSAVLVSTDDEEIARRGPPVRRRRPVPAAGRAGPRRHTGPARLRARAALARAGARAGSPSSWCSCDRPRRFRPVGMVDEAVSLLRAHPGADSVRAVTAPSQTPFKMWRLRGPAALARSSAPSRRSSSTRRASACRPSTGRPGTSTSSRPRDDPRDSGSMTGRRIVPLVVDPRYAVDIDTLEQLELAEWLLARDTVTLVRPEASAEGRVTSLSARAPGVPRPRVRHREGSPAEVGGRDVRPPPGTALGPHAGVRSTSSASAAASSARRLPGLDASPTGSRRPGSSGTSPSYPASSGSCARCSAPRPAFSSTRTSTSASPPSTGTATA